MSSAAVVQKLVQRAKQAEEIIAQLKAQIENVKQVAAISVSKPEEKRLREENEKLKVKIDTLKTALIMCEIKNGVKQVPIPTKKLKMEPAGGDSASQPETKTAEVKPQVAKETKPKQEKKGKQEDANKKKGDDSGKGKKKDAAADADRPIDISRLDLRVGKIVGVKKHPDADSLYVEDVDLGEGQTRTIVSGLVKHVPIEEMQDRLAVFMCNLKAAKMRGILSQGMIMCASCPEKVEILLPPPGAQIGDRVFAKDYKGEPDALLNPKKKIWETIKPDLQTDGDKVAAYKGSQLFIDGKGPVVAPTRANTQIS
ncbi:aminoacyl tRNA synthase complex-interacting multifunctional protein 1-like isoform X2 [Ruditapes philippinarum]|uniref:aminoacyl tRNA synthase complex-interacting multifunctional protein 1-like isoform X2 n=1 Tax=Ruditapes philippinarum TaxID=129788 RepID=UPI00295B70C2|nr:aminoacyl tRNA synthase complex-interacting multifunctional protein 1-like isoform X2 [Ruditapes philippinarum]